MHTYTHTYIHTYIHYRAIATSTAGPVLAEPLILKVKTKFHFYNNPIVNKSDSVINGLILLHYNYQLLMHSVYCYAHKLLY